MALTIDDLKPKDFKINVKGVELACKPLRLSHALIVAKLGDVFQNPKNYNNEEIRKAETDIDELISELVPELKGIQLDTMTMLDVITQLTDSNDPSENKELKEKGVSFESDPKDEQNNTRIG